MRERGERAGLGDGARFVEIAAVQDVHDLRFRQRVRLHGTHLCGKVFSGGKAGFAVRGCAG